MGEFNRRGFRRGFGGPREMFDVTCDKCGAKTQVPFKPIEGRKVFCKTCYEEVRNQKSTDKTEEE